VDEEMIVSVVQNKVYEDVEETKAEIEALLDQTDLSKTDVLMFAEMFLCPYDNASFERYKVKEKDEVFDWLKGLAEQHNVYLVAGSMPVKEKRHLYNRSYVFDRHGRELVHYDKTHLFKVVYPDGRVYDESEVLTKGDKFVLFDTSFGRAGLLICFDIRFPEAVSYLASHDAKVLFLPAQFNTYTGPLHWRATMRARAIDHQMYVVAASTARDSFGDYEPYGHSMVVDPYGEVVKEVGEEACVFTVELDYDQVRDVRKSIPILKNRREELY
jgi:predicted amidohydrolase